MAQSPQVIVDDRGTRWLQAMLAGSQAFGEGLGKLGEAIGSLRERQKQFESEDVAKDIFKKYGVQVSELEKKSRQEKWTPERLAEEKRGWLVDALVDVASRNPQGAMMASEVMSTVDPMLGIGKAGLTAMVESGRMSRAQMTDERITEAERAKAERARRADLTRRQSTEFSANVIQSMRLPPAQRMTMLGAMTEVLPDQETGEIFLDASTRKLWADAVNKTLGEQVNLSREMSLKALEGQTVESKISNLQKHIDSPDLPSHDAAAAAGLLADLRAEVDKEASGFHHTVEALAITMRNEGVPINHSLPVPPHAQIYAWLSRSPAFSSALDHMLTGTEQDKRAARASLASQISARLSAPAITGTQQMMAMFATSPAQTVGNMIPNSLDPKGIAKLIDEFKAIHSELKKQKVAPR